MPKQTVELAQIILSKKQVIAMANLFQEISKLSGVESVTLTETSVGTYVELKTKRGATLIAANGREHNVGEMARGASGIKGGEE